jgi:uncharacterized protein YbjT (DUF2867 family)
MHYPLVTIVGGSGFVGRHTVKLLASAGYRIRIITRDTVAADFLKTAATVGSIATEYGDITRPETLAGKFANSDAVINLVGIMHESGRQKFGAIHVEGARAIAAEAKKAGVPRFVQVSALAADRAVDTKYGSTKLAGEKAVREVFPEATILRPSLIVGPEDRFFQRFAKLAMVLPGLPLIGGGKTRFQPVLVTDVATAILDAVRREDMMGKTYELGGPKIYSFREMLQLMSRTIHRFPHLFWVPSALAAWKGFVLEKLPFPPIITRDQVKLLAHDNIVSDGALTFASLGIQPAPVAEALPQLLSRYIKQ